MIQVAIEPTFASFRERARALLAEGRAPADVSIRAGSTPQSSLFGEATKPSAASLAPLRVSRHFVDLAEIAALHREEGRFDLLYRVLHRLANGRERALLDIATDPDVARLNAMVQSVRRDEHKMHAYVRFRRVVLDGQERFVAWYQPDHYIVPLVAPFFRDRFPSMRWTLLTPDAAAHWDGETISFGPGATRRDAPSGDELEDLFRSYYRSVFNPARVNLKVMRGHMPQRRWQDLPETQIVRELAASAVQRVEHMGKRPRSGSFDFMPAERDIPSLREAAKTCRGCDIGCRATQTVFGEGPIGAEIMVVGEQPGDEEDQRGRPFVGPAGRVLDRAMIEVGLDRERVYLTNAVKHFKWVPEPRGKRRIHSKPAGTEIDACWGWLEAEVAAVAPKVIVCLGSSAARAFVGPRFSVSRDRGKVYRTPWTDAWLATYHPSAVLRAENPAASEAIRKALTEDLYTATTLAQKSDG